MVLWTLLSETFREWRNDRATLQGAALAFYALFSAAPLLVVATAVVGWLLGPEAAAEKLDRELRTLLSPEIAAAVRVLVDGADHHRGPGWAAGSLGLLASLYGGARGFLHLQATLNQVWGVRAIRGPGMVEVVRRKLLAFASVALCGLLLLASLVATIVFHALASRASEALQPGWLLARIGEEGSTLGIVTVLLCVVYKTLPDVRIQWRDVVVGAGVSAALFVGGKHGIAYYLRTVGAGSTFGAASALAAMLLYTQYVAQVLLFGAEFTFVFARWRGQPILPGVGAARVVRTTVHGP